MIVMSAHRKMDRALFVPLTPIIRPVTKAEANHRIKYTQDLKPLTYEHLRPKNLFVVVPDLSDDDFDLIK
jgi:hypothetical protein